MLEIYFTEKDTVYLKLNSVLSQHLTHFEILRTENGKPYIEGDPLFFSLSHSGNKALIALGDKPLGVDLEVVADRKYGGILNRFSLREQAEIVDGVSFLRHWVVREAYIKMLGGTLAEKLKTLEYAGGILYDNSDKVDCEIINGCKDGCVYSICINK